MAAPDRGRGPFRRPAPYRSEEPNSLFGEILDWMLAPLLLLWPISIAATHHVANQIADQPYDQALADNVAAIARLVRLEDGRVVVNLPVSARTILHASGQDDLYYQVRDSYGHLLAGDEAIPVPSGDKEPVLEEVRFRDERLAGEAIRVAYQVQALDPGRRWIVIQVAETRRKREALASEIISGVLLPQFAIIPLAVILVWLGLSRGLRPLSLLRHKLGERRPGDLSPIDSRGVPEELQPMVRSFNELLVRLEENLQAQQRFIADAAHQMRTPVTGLRMQADLAVTEQDPAQLRRSVEQIARGAERAGHLINQLLTLARAESSHDKIHKFETVDLEELARDVTRDWVVRAMAKSVDLGFEGTDRPLPVAGVPLLLRELLNNLVDNALKYTPAGGRVTVRTRIDDRFVVEVEDSGIGVPPEDRERVFERFYRVLGTNIDGSGLGLPICREIAELHRVVISLGPGPEGVGTCVTLRFPLTEMTGQSAGQTAG
jgi:two-component system sensor histidine kinase TctE